MVAKTKNITALQIIFSISATYGCDIAPPTPASAKDKLRIGQKNSDSDDATKNQKTGRMDPKSWSQRLGILQESAAKTAIEMTEIQRQLMQIFSIRDALCERQSQLMNDCGVHTPLSPLNWRPAGCASAKNKWQLRTYTAEINSVSGKFQLVLDNAIESNVFVSETPQKIQWTTRGSRSLKDLKLSDVGSFKLKAVSGTFQDIKSIQFKLKLDDELLLSNEDFIESGSTDSVVIINHLPVTKKLSSTECVVDDNEIDKIIQDSVAAAKQPENLTLPSLNPELPVEENARNFQHWISDTRLQYEAKSDIYLAAAQDISRLRRDLRGELQLGCRGREIIRSLEIAVKGEHLPASDWDRSQTSVALGITGSPTQTVIDFGGGLRFTNTDENTTPIFHENGKWLANATTDLTIGDISTIIIQKGGYSYQATRNCWSTWGGLGTACEWQNRETDRYRLDSLSVKINGQLIYERDALNFTFERSTPNWIEKELTSNLAYISMMRRRDCPATSELSGESVP
jgi:hypothetical protein